MWSGWVQGNSNCPLVPMVRLVPTENDVIPMVLLVNGSFENEALENEDRSTKHPNLENEVPKTRNHCRLNNYNFTSSMTQSESGGGSGSVRTSKGRQNPSQGFIKACQLFNWTFLDRISCINFIISLRVAIIDTSYLNMHFLFGTYTYM